MGFWKGHLKKHWRKPGVLFFKEIMDQKLKDPAFREFYEKECHICSNTIKVIAGLEEREQPLSDILDALNISKQAYEDLKDAENCDPELVKQLCSYLDLKGSDRFKNCPKLK